jgi:hypothetical protein
MADLRTTKVRRRSTAIADLLRPPQTNTPRSDGDGEPRSQFLFVRIIGALWALIKVRLPKERESASQAAVKKAADHLLVAKWALEQSLLAPRHAKWLHKAAAKQFQIAKRMVARLNRSAGSPFTSQSAQRAGVTPEETFSENYFG